MEQGVLALGAARPPEVTRTMVGLRNLQVFRGEFKAPKFDLQKMMVGPCHFYGTLPTDSRVTSYKLVLPSSDHGGVIPFSLWLAKLCSHSQSPLISSGRWVSFAGMDVNLLPPRYHKDIC